METLEKKRGRKKIPLSQKFETYIDKSGECWIWTGTLNNYGYGMVLDDSNILKSVHRLMYERHIGEIPNRASIMHSCDNPACCNPEHLEAGSSKQNMKDKVLKGRDHSNRGLNHWKAKLTDEQISLIREDSRTQTTIAREYGISQPQVSIIKSLKTRKVLGIKQEPRQLELQFTF